MNTQHERNLIARLNDCNTELTPADRHGLVAMIERLWRDAGRYRFVRLQENQADLYDGDIVQAYIPWGESLDEAIDFSMKEKGHDSDCAVYNEPAYPNGPCNCSLSNPAESVSALSLPGKREGE